MFLFFSPKSTLPFSSHYHKNPAFKSSTLVSLYRMTVAGAATSHTKKLMKLTLSVIWPRFNSSKCKTAAKMAVARIKLLRNKREVVVRQMRRDIALLLQSGQDATARIRVEHVIREQNVLAANEFIELFCELVVSRLPIIAKRKECPADLKEGIASIIFASPRCSEIPELTSLRKIFEKKYGKDFVSTATDLRPNSGVNRLLVDKLSVRTPSGEVKLKIMKEIAKEHQIQWDTAECEKELLKPPEELIEGHRTFVSASSLPVPKSAEPSVPISRSISKGTGNVHFQDMASAAEAAAESAKQAIAAAQAAAYIANKGNQASTFDHNLMSGNHGFGGISGNSTGLPMPNDPKTVHQIRNYQSNAPGAGPIQMNEETRSVQMNHEHTYRRYSYNETRPAPMDGHGVYYRRHSYNNPSLHSDIKFDEEDCKGVDRSHSYNTNSSSHSDVKFDESDYDEEIEMEEPHARVYPPPNRPAPPPPSSLTKRSSFPQIHPKLPDYDALSARFESLKHRKS